MRKKCYRDREKRLKFEAEGREFANFLRSLERFIQTVKGKNNFWQKNAFLTCSSGGVSYLKNYSNYNLNWKKLLGFRNMQENLENIIILCVMTKVMTTDYKCPVKE